MSLTMGAAARRFGRIAPVSCLAIVAVSTLAARLLAADSSMPSSVGRVGPSVNLPMLHAAPGEQGTTANSPDKPFEDTYWRAVELSGKMLPAQNANREAHLIFRREGRLSGSDGCNRIAGTYQRTGDALTFGQLVGTQMACVNTGEIEQAFGEAIKNTAHLAVTGDRLRLSDNAGSQVAVFVAGSQTAALTPPSLSGTSWQLVTFRSGDGKTLIPDGEAGRPGVSTSICHFVFLGRDLGQECQNRVTADGRIHNGARPLCPRGETCSQPPARASSTITSGRRGTRTKSRLKLAKCAARQTPDLRAWQ